MNDPVNDPGTPQSNSELAAQIDALRRQAFVLLLALIVVSGALATYLFYEYRIMSKTVDGIKPQAMQVINTYKQVTATLNTTSLSNFVNQITAYAIAHPEFRPVLQKYGWAPPPPPPAPVKK